MKIEGGFLEVFGKPDNIKVLNFFLERTRSYTMKEVSEETRIDESEVKKKMNLFGKIEILECAGGKYYIPDSTIGEHLKEVDSCLTDNLNSLAMGGD